MKNRKNKLKHNTLDYIIHHNFLNLNKQLTRRDGISLDSDSVLREMMFVKNNGSGDSTPDAETRITSPENSNGFILCL